MGVDVLCANAASGRMAIAARVEYTGCLAVDVYGPWFWGPSDGMWPKESATHWMPLPHPPIVSHETVSTETNQ
jgi:hypothetical protein